MKQNLEYKFQFHKSTIKTPKTAPPSLCLLYFNSIKVRLKLALSFFVYSAPTEISIP